jgi:hypothetical protein
LRFPTNTILEVGLTDFILAQGALTNPAFPPTPNSEMQTQALYPPLPAFDNSSLYLPMMLTVNGFIFDDSCIGDIVSESTYLNYDGSISTSTNRLIADGSRYDPTLQSPLGIPYSRLWNKYWNETTNVPAFGTGPGYFISSDRGGSAISLDIFNNDAGAVTDTVDFNTGFLIYTTHTGNDYQASAYDLSGLDGLVLRPNSAGTVGIPENGTTSFSFEYFKVTKDEFGNVVTDSVREQTVVIPVAAASIVAGTYWTFQIPSQYPTAFYYVWYTIDGAGADPVPVDGVGIRVDLLSTDTQQVVAYTTANAISGHQITHIETVAASAMTTGDYFLVSSITESFYVWYDIAGGGGDPNLPGKIGIEVDLAGTETAPEVATATIIAINKKYFAVPDLQGVFLRGWDPLSKNDPELVYRFSKNSTPTIEYNAVGTFQYDSVYSHNHPGTNLNPAVLEPPATVKSDVVDLSDYGVTGFTGEAESRPINFATNLVILY